VCQPDTVQWWHGYGQRNFEKRKSLNAQQKRGLLLLLNWLQFIWCSGNVGNWGNL